MAEETLIIEDKKIIKIKSRGKSSTEDILATKENVRLFSEKENIEILLIDAREQVCSMNTFEIFEYFTNKIKLLHLVKKIAFVISMENDVDARFIETIAVNRGGLVSIFFTEHEAIDWLTD